MMQCSNLVQKVEFPSRTDGISIITAAETLKCKLCWQSKCLATQQLVESSFLTFDNASKMMDVHQRIFLTQWYFCVA